MKVVDDKLKIIDDVPNSAVEMAVKEKVSDEDAWASICILYIKKCDFLVSKESPETR